MKLMTTLAAIAVCAGFAAAGTGNPDSGRKLYQAKCAACHGKDGKGSAPMAKMFKVEPAELDLTSAQAQKKPFADIVANGIKDTKMPGFKGKLKDSEIADINAYLLSLAPPAPGAKAADKPPAKP